MGKKITVVFIAILICFLFVGCKTSESRDLNSEMLPQKIGEVELKYAKEFSIDLYEKGYCLICISDGSKYVLVPSDEEDNNLGFEDAVILRQPSGGIYLAASSVMDLFRQLDALELIKSCSTKASDYTIEEAREKIENGEIVYVGKYSAPDYETLLSLNTELAIESTMILHTPRVKEELESLGIPVFVDRSSYEAEPLGRLEWIKLYGLLVGKEAEANAFFEQQIQQLEAAIKDGGDNENTKVNKVVFFYITSNGYVNVRKPNDYISKMIELAGGEYALKSIKVEEENALSTMNISWEDFYVYAKEADILIYNKTVNDGIQTIDELVDKNPVFADFKAVQEGKVFCSTNNMYQETSKIGEVILEMKAIFDGNYSDIRFFYPVGGEE